MSHLPRISKPLSQHASDINTMFQETVYDINLLPEEERLRLIVAMTAQLAAMAAKIMN